MRKITTKKGVKLLVPEKGEKHAGAGRPKGSKNKITLGLREAFLAAVEAVGEDGRGKNGLTGYLIKMARTRPDLTVRMFCKILALEAKVAAKAEQKQAYNQQAPAMPPRYKTLDDVRAEVVAFLEKIDAAIAARRTKTADQDAAKHGLQ